MLTLLRVKNLALVEDISVSFAPGLNIITGETGAGKSILIGALNLLLGERADKSLVRAGADACAVQAVFELADPEALNSVLDELGLDPCESGALIIRRTVKANGGHQALLNDNPVTLQALKRIGEKLVDMHGPYDHQSLLKTDTQRDILDAFGHVFKTREAYENAYTRMRDIERRRDELEQQSGGDVAEQIDLLRFKVKEIEDARLSESEEQEVQDEHRVFGNAQRIVELAGATVTAMTDGEQNAFDAMTVATRALDELARILPEAETWRTEAESLCMQMKELSAAIALRIERMDADPSRLAWLDDRLTTYQKMKRKYGPTIADVLHTLEKSAARLADLTTRDERLEELEAERVAVEKEVLRFGADLHKERKAVAGKLEKAVTDELRALGFAHGRFGVSVEKNAPTPSGLDAIEFGFEPNVGEGMRPLRHIASSGEISRVMLATKAVLARHDQIPLMVFDEIDANVGGETGAAVGRKLQEVAGHHQIICITHLPQVAMHGAAHYAVRKQVKDGRTYTEVAPLEGEARVEEMARMLGGRDMTGVTLKHAREMLENATNSSRTQSGAG
jgi:DNA repair protein RecN (Recombination protein N)